MGRRRSRSRPSRAPAALVRRRLARLRRERIRSWLDGDQELWERHAAALEEFVTESERYDLETELNLRSLLADMREHIRKADEVPSVLDDSLMERWATAIGPPRAPAAEVLAIVSEVSQRLFPRMHEIAGPP